MRHTWPARFDKLLETVEMNTNDFVAADHVGRRSPHERGDLLCRAKVGNPPHDGPIL